MLKIFFKSLKPLEWVLLLLTVGLIVFQVWLDLKMPEYMREISELANTPGSPMNKIWAAGGMMLLLTACSVAVSVVAAGTTAKISTTFAARLRLSVFDKVQSLTMGEINKFSIASLITRSTNDISQIQLFLVIGLQILIKSPILAVWAIIKIVGRGWEWSAATAVAVGVLIVFFIIFVVLVLPKFKKLQVETDELNRTARESLTGLRVVRAYNAEDYQEAKFEKANEKLTRTNLFTGKMFSALFPCIDVISNGLMLALYWIGALLVSAAAAEGKIGVFSSMMEFSLYATQILSAFMMLMMVFLYLPRAAVGSKRIKEVLAAQSAIGDGTLTEGLKGERGRLEFKNVSFKYPEAQDYVLENVTFSANKGETVAFIGTTGSGKSTIVNLIPRFYDATEGEICVDGVNVKDYTQKSLRDKIGYVAQKAKLFSGTIASNVSFGSGAQGKPDGESIAKAIKIAQAEEFVQKYENTVEARVAQGGTNFSGGQKQRLSIARAVARNPEILIFDDSFSALDYKTDRTLRSVIKKEIRESTVLIVAQRISTIRTADKILVLEDGKVVGMGRHEELMRDCKVYQEIAYSQLSKEELA